MMTIGTGQERHKSIASAKIARSFENVPLDKLRPDPKNPRLHHRRQVAELARGMETLGINTTITVDEDYNILAGHGRYLAAKELGLAELPAIVVPGLTPAQRRAFMIADNKLGDLSSFDPGLLLDNIEEILSADVNFDATLTGFQTAELDPLCNAKRAAAQNDLKDELPSVLPKHTVSRRGDIFEMNGHRIGTGDATDRDFMETLLGGAAVGLVISDVPFNLQIAGVVSGLGRHKHGNFAMAAGEMSRAEYVQFLRRSASAYLPQLMDGAMVLLFIDWRHVTDMIEAGEMSRFELKNILVWIKDNAGMGSLWRSQHELICAFKYGKRPHRNNVQLGVHGRHRSNVLQYPGMNSLAKGRGKALELHATVKPVALIADLILDVSDRDDLVLDPFGGSGTTIIAAEQVGRRAILCEIEPRFVDVAIRRWQDLTGGTAILVSTGETFAGVETRRLTGGGGE